MAFQLDSVIHVTGATGGIPGGPPQYQTHYHSGMAVPVDRARLSALADKIVADILRAAASWAREVPPALTLPIRAVCVRLAEMAADQRHYLAPLPEPQETERRTTLELVAEKLRSREWVALATSRRRT